MQCNASQMLIHYIKKSSISTTIELDTDFFGITNKIEHRRDLGKIFNQSDFSCSKKRVFA